MQERPPQPFVDRRRPTSSSTPVIERRQFANSHDELSPAARELGIAIDRYKLSNRRRFITYEEILYVIKSLDYAKQDEHAVAVSETPEEVNA